MDKEKKKMVEKLQRILTQIKNEKGTVNLFMIIKMENLTDKWTVYIAAPWITQLNRNEMFTYIRGFLLSNLSNEEQASIGGIGLIENTNHMVDLFTRDIRVTDGFVRLQDTAINGYKIHDAYIFESNVPSNT